MLRCSKCGTINADGKSFCNSCGAKLDRTSIKCPKCGTQNAVGNIFCIKCQTQLVSPDAMIPPEEEDSTITPVKGISLPTRVSSGEETSMPDWLQQLAEDVQAKSTDELSEENGIDLATDDQASFELPDWLSDPVNPDERFGSDSDTEIDSQVDASPSTEELPDWLSSESDDLPETELKPESNAEDVLISAQLEDTPAADIPDWLSAIADEIDAAASMPSGTPEIPDWLSSIAEDSDAASPTKSDQPLPDWLKPAFQTQPDDSDQTADIVEEDFEETGSQEPATAPESDLDWSAELTEDVEQPRSLLNKLEHEITPLNQDSLDTSGAEAQVPVRTMGSEQADADIDLTPDWMSIPLTDIADIENEDKEDGVEEEESESEIPDWLSNLGEQAFEGEQTTTPKLSAQTVETKEDLPSWLSEINVSQEAPEDSQAVFTPESIETIAYETQLPETPAWLDEVTPPPEIIAIRPAAPAFIPADEEVDLKSDEEDSELETAEAVSFPSWLNELRLPKSDEDPGSMTADTDFSVPAGELFGGLDQILPSETDDLARAEVPEWLHDLKPPAGSPWPSLAAIPSKEALEVEEITPAVVPDWVQSLKPKPGESKEKPPERVLPSEPAEIEGPLSSLSGILPPSTAIDMPANYEVNLVKIPENVIRQAQLWQQLLGRPRSDVRKVAHREASTNLRSTIIRIVVSAILILGSLAAIWLLPTSNLAVTAPMGKKPGLQKFVDSVDALQQGETVIVAVEYGWAQSEEMTAIANAVLDHLRDQEVNVIAVSTMPEGTAIIPHLLESNKLNNILSGNAIYLPGYASGIAGFFKEPEAQSASMLIVLSSNFERIRWWIEQNHIALNATGSIPLKVNTGLSASVGPLTTPYLDEQNSHGWMVGFQDSINYQALRGLQNAEQSRILDVLLVMHWSAIIILIIGFLYTTVLGKKRIA